MVNTNAVAVAINNVLDVHNVIVLSTEITVAVTNELKETFEQKMARFLKDSEDRLTSLKRNTESKRGGRGARRG